MGGGSSQPAKSKPRERAKVTLKDVPVLGTNKKRVQGSWVTVHVFVSSTFKDMHAERDAITRIIFPNINERCRSRRVRLVPTDLRWGLTEEDTSEKGKGAIEICLEEVDRARGWFIVLLGERYGWVPDHYKVSDAPQYDWLKHAPAGLSVTEIEVRHMFLNNVFAPVHGIVMNRDPALLKRLPRQQTAIFNEAVPASVTKLNTLREKIRESPFVSVVDGYASEFAGTAEDGTVNLTGLEDFEKHVGDFLWEAVEREFPAELRPLDAIALEERYHDEAIENLTRLFLGREEAVADLEKYVRDPLRSSATPFLITGERGSGKSALAARFAKDYMMRHDAKDPALCIPFFVGVSPTSDNVRDMMYYLCGRLTEKLGGSSSALPQDLRNLRPLFTKLLNQLVDTMCIPVVIVIDGIEHLDTTVGRADMCAWLPHLLPKGVRIVVTVKDNEYLRGRRPVMPEHILRPLTPEQARHLVTGYLKQYAKRLSPDQLEILLAKQADIYPLYLVVACEEVRIYGHFDNISKFIKDLPPSTNDVFHSVLTRLCADHPMKLIKEIFTLLAASRNGLLERELLSMLARKGERQYPRMMWLRVFSEFQIFVQRPSEAGEGLIDFFYVQFEMAVRKRWLCDCPVHCEKFEAGDYCPHVHSGAVLDGWDDKDGAAHRRLAEFFRSQADPNGDRTWEGAFVGWGDFFMRSYLDRCMDELSYHLVLAGMWDEVEKVLTDFVFIEKRCAAGMTFDLINDYQHAIDMLRARIGNERSKEVARRMQQRVERLEEYLSFIQSVAHLLTNRSELLLQEAANLPSDSAPAKTALERFASGLEARPWLRKLIKGERRDACFMLLGHVGKITGVAVGPDTIVSVDDHGEIILWSLAGEELARLHYNASATVGCVSAVDLSPDGSQFVTGDLSNTNVAGATLWATASRDVSWRLTFGQIGSLNAVRFTPAGDRIVVAGGKDDSSFLSVVSVASGKVVSSYPGHLSAVTSICFAPPNRFISGSQDCTLRVWDTDTRECVRTLGTARQHGPAGKRSGGAASASPPMAPSPSPFAPSRTKRTRRERGGTEDQTTTTLPLRRTETTPTVAVAATPLTPDASKSMSSFGQPRKRRRNKSPSPDKEIADKVDVGVLLRGDSGESLSGASSAPATTLTPSPSAPKTRARSPTVTAAFAAAVFSDASDLPAKGGKRAVPTERPSGPLVASHSKSVKCCSFDRARSTLASGGADDCIIVWDLSNADPKQWAAKWVLEGHDNDVEAVTFAAGGAQLFSCSRDETLRAWSMEKGKELSTIRGALTASHECVWDPSGTRLITAGDAGLRVWTAEYLKECVQRPELLGQQGGVAALAFSPRGSMFAAGFGDIEERGRPPKRGRNNVCLYATGRVNTKPQVELSGHTQRVTCLAYSPDSRYILSGSADTTLRVWDAETGRCMHVFDGHTDAIQKCTYSPDGETVASTAGTERGRIVIKIWDASAVMTRATSTSVANFSGHKRTVSHMLFTPDSTLLVTADADEVRVWDIENEDCLGVVLDRSQAHPLWVCSLPGPHHSFFVSYGQLGTFLYTVRAATPGSSERSVDTAWTEKETPAAFCCCSADGRYLATASDAPGQVAVMLYEMENGLPSEPRRLPRARKETVTVHLGFSKADPPQLLEVAVDRVSQVETTVCLWNAANGVLLHSLLYSHPIPQIVSTSSNCMFIGGGDAEGTVTLLAIEGVRDLVRQER